MFSEFAPDVNYQMITWMIATNAAFDLHLKKRPYFTTRFKFTKVGALYKSSFDDMLSSSFGRNLFINLLRCPLVLILHSL